MRDTDALSPRESDFVQILRDGERSHYNCGLRKESDELFPGLSLHTTPEKMEKIIKDSADKYYNEASRKNNLAGYESESREIFRLLCKLFELSYLDGLKAVNEEMRQNA